MNHMQATAEQIANDTSLDWSDGIMATAELEHKRIVAEHKVPKNKPDPLSLADRAYIAKFHAYDGSTMLGALFGKRRQYIDSLVKRMKESGEYDAYCNLSDEQYERLIQTAERNGSYAM